MQWRPGAVNPSDLIASCSAGGDVSQTLLNEILGHFVRQNRDRLDAGLRALEAADRVKVAEIAHAIKGSAAMIGAGYLSHLAYQVELDAPEMSPAMLVSHFTALCDEFEA